jgi:hypothetical protein
VVLTVLTVPPPIELPLLVKVTVPVATPPPVSIRALNVALPPNVIGFALEAISVTVGVGPARATDVEVLPLDAKKFPSAG